ncbi:hypothetical protein, unknown function [Leishmania mexicana MHOM/GT/2001/U1103]|uniref:Uncharacterized protein n=1 Tax=Leishmania mexicana (strain MHOM/GT/2001/U1103) TaxID=929439 RepID=E9ANX0_LEIMU|nr:hypothetical protein, unknown function [Leishmania mexicana MHOM/GT/2001/U1103]CBZ24634.1 hypothetical protein, unknown function [Leishmania mexicana MHOM/GT/2001/U1103]
MGKGSPRVRAVGRRVCDAEEGRWDHEQDSVRRHAAELDSGKRPRGAEGAEREQVQLDHRPRRRLFAGRYARHCAVCRQNNHSQPAERRVPRRAWGP